ncbi:MAG: hypothetical protein LBV30_01325 [Propionibacteriaceae bacterium]|jgi:hypothetical protein|nr:hypothetical protein [Propionibacteriaceae bacterium]
MTAEILVLITVPLLWLMGLVLYGLLLWLIIRAGLYLKRKTPAAVQPKTEQIQQR